VKASVISTLLVLIVSSPVPARAAELEFEGTPTVKVVVSEGATRSSPVSGLDATDLHAVVVRDGDRYLWKSRKNTPLSKSVSGSYITYTALNGSGYIRVLSPEMRKLREQLPAEQRAKEYVYMEHLVSQLQSITYFGM
jgi:hypothetical protein